MRNATGGHVRGIPTGFDFTPIAFENLSEVNRWMADEFIQH